MRTRHGRRVNIGCDTFCNQNQSNLESLTSEAHKKSSTSNAGGPFEKLREDVTQNTNRRLTPSVLSDIVIVMQLFIESLLQTAE